MDNEINGSLNKAIRFLIKNQKPEGYWIAGFPKESISTALGATVYTEYGKMEEAEKAINWLLNNQNEDGGWGDIPGRKSDLNCTACALAALTLYGCNDDNIKKAENWFYSHGGYADVSVQLLPYLTYANLFPWNEIKVPPLSIISDPVMFDESKFVIAEPMFFLERLSIMEVSLIKTIFVSVPFEKAFIPYAIKTLKRYQCENGSWLGYLHSTALALLAMKSCDYYDESVTKALDWLVNLQDVDGGITLEKGLAVHDTSLSMMTLIDAGIKNDSNPLTKAKKWLLSAQTISGGWGWMSLCTGPDADDTALSIMTLSRFDSSPQTRASMERGARWIIHRQLEDGSIATFPIDYDGYIKGGKLVFLSVTARSVIALLNTGHMNEAKKAAKFLMNVISDGNLYSGIDWFFGSLYPTELAIEALIAMGENKSVFKNIVETILSIQKEDGSWGTTKEGSCVEETALSIKALLLCDIEPHSTSIQKGISYILNKQNDEGSWNPTPLGYYPPVSYYNSIWTLYLVMEALSMVTKCKDKD